MDIDSYLQWIQGTSLATNIRNGLLLFPLLESIHVIALALVFGTIAIIDLRLLGFASTERPFRKMAADILKWTWAAFALSAITGALMFTTNATVYYHNFYFRAKMVLLLLSGINMGIFELTAGRAVRDWDTARTAPTIGKIAAFLSITIWIAVIFTGRLIGFTTSRATAAPPPPPGVSFDDFLGK